MSSSTTYSDDPKMAMYDSERSSKPYLGIALLVMSLILGVTVSALVYQSVVVKRAPPCQQQTGSSQNPAQTNVDVKSTITLKTDDDKRVKEEISFSQVENVAYYHGQDGSFDVDDFGKGLHITRDARDGTCYLIAVGSSNQTRDHEFEQLLQKADGTEMLIHADNSRGENMQAQILPGEVTDTSFIPQRAHQECLNGYKWMAFIPASRATGERQKRDICYSTYIIYYYYAGYIRARTYTVYYWC